MKDRPSHSYHLHSTQHLNEPVGSADLASLIYDAPLQLVSVILATGPRQSSLNRNPQFGKGRKTVVLHLLYLLTS